MQVCINKKSEELEHFASSAIRKTRVSLNFDCDDKSRIKNV